jgi:hypothetical protein
MIIPPEISFIVGLITDTTGTPHLPYGSYLHFQTLIDPVILSHNTVGELKSRHYISRKPIMMAKSLRTSTIHAISTYTCTPQAVLQALQA